MQVYSFTPMDVKELIRPALTTADLARLARADAYHFDAGNGWHIFGQACANERCFGCWQAKVHISWTREFASAIDRACDVEAVCDACKPVAAGSSLIRYTPKSGSSGAGGGGKGRGHRNRQSGASGDARVSKRQIEARINELARMIADPGQTPDEQIVAWQREQDALAYALATYPTRRRKAA